MGVAERRLREKEARRITILNAAEEVFFDRGPDNATMDEVAEKAELSKGLLYVYFANKDDLVHAIASRGLAVLIESVEAELEKHKKGIDQVYALGSAYVRFARTYPDYFNLMAWAQARAPEGEKPENAIRCDEMGQKAIFLTAQAVGNGIADGSIRPELDPLQTAISLYAQTHGVIAISLSKNAKTELLTDPDSLVRSSLELIRHGLARHSA